MLGNQQTASVKMACHAPKYACITCSHAVIDIRLGQFCLQNQEQRKVYGTHGPQKIRKNNMRVSEIITLLHNIQEIRSHQQIINGKVSFLKHIENSVPVHLFIHDNTAQSPILFRVQTCPLAVFWFVPPIIIIQICLIHG